MCLLIHNRYTPLVCRKNLNMMKSICEDQWDKIHNGYYRIQSGWCHFGVFFFVFVSYRYLLCPHILMAAE
jgi:hypothetical protein